MPKPLPRSYRNFRNMLAAQRVQPFGTPPTSAHLLLHLEIQSASAVIVLPSFESFLCTRHCQDQQQPNTNQGNDPEPFARLVTTSQAPLMDARGREKEACAYSCIVSMQ